MTSAWRDERDPDRSGGMLHDNARAVRDAVKNRVEAGRDMDLHYGDAVDSDGGS